MIRLFLIAGVFVLLSAHAEAASFDCRRAKTPFEKAVCANTELSRLDEEMAAAYRAALKGLSPQGAQSLRQNQRRWLSVADGCMQSPNADACLQALYLARVNDFTIKAKAIGPYQVIDLFAYAIETNQDEATRGENPFVLFRAPYPQIDLPVRPVLGEWNVQAADTGIETECGAEGGKAESGRAINQATDQLISVTDSYYYYCPNMAHGRGNSVNRTYILTPRLKLLEADDIFSAEVDWLNPLTELCVTALGDTYRVIEFRRVKDIAGDPRSWTLKKDGLEVFFGVYTIGAYAEGEHEVLIPWEQLKPYLRADAPIPR